MHLPTPLKTASLLLMSLLATSAATSPADPVTADGRVIVLGIDGGDFATVRDLIDAGRLPN
ncbi:MAG: hypothetical protein HRU14_18500, partial [Planctomycetes bacterium]|nr:hypothetical protein [Planctomycetota bacterium]